MMLPELRVPEFPRLEEYIGTWAMEPVAFVAMWNALERFDLAAHMASPPPPVESKMELLSNGKGKSVAFIPILGTLMKQQSSMGGTSTIQLRRDIRQAAADPNVGAILLGVESPGGVTAGLDDLAADVRAARKQKPVFAHIDDLCASAAYWIASQCEAIYANSAMALVGSIGTIMTVYDRSGEAEQSGVKALVFATGPLKGAGVPGSEVTPEQQAYFRGIVAGAQRHFDAAVRKGREFNAKALKDVKTGGVWMASRPPGWQPSNDPSEPDEPTALDLGLINGVQPLSKTLDQLATRAASPGPRADSDPGPVVLNFPMLRRVLPMRNIGE